MPCRDSNEGWGWRVGACESDETKATCREVRAAGESSSSCARESPRPWICFGGGGGGGGEAVALFEFSFSSFSALPLLSFCLSPSSLRIRDWTSWG